MMNLREMELKLERKFYLKSVVRQRKSHRRWKRRSLFHWKQILQEVRLSLSLQSQRKNKKMKRKKRRLRMNLLLKMLLKMKMTAGMLKMSLEKLEHQKAALTEFAPSCSQSPLLRHSLHSCYDFESELKIQKT